MNASKSKLSLSFWLALAALVVGAWPLFVNARQILDYSNNIAQAFSTFDWSIPAFQYIAWVTLPLTEPLVLLVAVFVNAFFPSRALRAIASALFPLGVLIFFILNLITCQMVGQPTEDAWGWTFGSAPASYLYGLAILLSVAAAIASLLNKPAASSSFGLAAASGRQPVAFDTATGQPIYGYDTNTGTPIY